MSEEKKKFYQAKTKEWSSERIEEEVNLDQMSRGLMKLTEEARGKVNRQVDSPWMRGKKEAIRLRGAIRKNLENERNRKTKRKYRGS